MTSKQDFNRIFQTIGKNDFDKIVKDDITQSGSLIVLHTPFGEELGMVLRYIPKKELRDYCKKHNVKIDRDSEIWQHHYAVVGHYKKEELEALIRAMNFTDKPALNLLIVKVNSKTSYNVVTGNSPEMVLLFDTIRNIAQDDAAINERLNKLVGVSAMSVMTDELREKYRQAQENPTENEVKISQGGDFSESEKSEKAEDAIEDTSEATAEDFDPKAYRENVERISKEVHAALDKKKNIPTLDPKEIVRRAREKGKKNRGEA